MKIIVTHLSPDLDAIGSVWVIKKFLPGWSGAQVAFVPAGNRLERVKNNPDFGEQAILRVGNDEIMHVDTGLGPLDHHQTSSMTTSGAMRSWEYVSSVLDSEGMGLKKEHSIAVGRVMKIIVDHDHFQEVYRPEPDADYHDFSLWGINEGLQYMKPGEDDYFMEFGRTCLDYIYSFFINKIWAEEEMKKGIEFEIRFGKCLGIESMNDSVIKLAQKKGYVLVARKDPKRGNVAVKTIPNRAHSVIPAIDGVQKNGSPAGVGDNNKKTGIDLTLAYEQMKKMDPNATWYLHTSKKMLLNGSVKNPDMIPTRLSLEQIMKVLADLYK